MEQRLGPAPTGSGAIAKMRLVAWLDQGAVELSCLRNSGPLALVTPPSRSSWHRVITKKF